MCSIQGLGKVDAPIPKCPPYLLATAAVLIPQTDLKHVETCWNMWNSWPLWFPENAQVPFLHVYCKNTNVALYTLYTVIDVPWIRSNLQQVRLQRAVEMARGMPCPLRRGLCIVDQPIGTGDPWRPKWCSKLSCSIYSSWVFLIFNPPRWQEKESLAKLRLTLAGSCWISHLSFRFHTLFNSHDMPFQSRLNTIETCWNSKV